MFGLCLFVSRRFVDMPAALLSCIQLRQLRLVQFEWEDDIPRLVIAAKSLRQLLTRTPCMRWVGRRAGGPAGGRALQPPVPPQNKRLRRLCCRARSACLNVRQWSCRDCSVPWLASAAAAEGCGSPTAQLALAHASWHSCAPVSHRCVVLCVVWAHTAHAMPGIQPAKLLPPAAKPRHLNRLPACLTAWVAAA